MKPIPLALDSQCLPDTYEAAASLAVGGQYKQARIAYATLCSSAALQLQALVINDLSVIDSLEGRFEDAREGFENALSLDPQCKAAKANLAFLAAQDRDFHIHSHTIDKSNASGRGSAPRIAIISFLFNWPSTGGGIIHTVELAHFLAKAGYSVKLFFPRFEPWELGRVDKTLHVDHRILAFSEADWNRKTIPHWRGAPPSSTT